MLRTADTSGTYKRPTCQFWREGLLLKMKKDNFPIWIPKTLQSWLDGQPFQIPIGSASSGWKRTVED